MLKPLLALLALGSLILFALLAEEPLDGFRRLWPVVPIAFAGAAFANATAVGGGFLFVPVFVLGYGLNPLVALKLSLGTQAFGMSSGALGWSASFIDRRALGLSLVGGLAGMWLGSTLWTPEPLQVKAAFGWVSLAIGVAMFLEFHFGLDRRGTRMGAERAFGLLLYLGCCFAGGLITAWVSLGIGEVVALWLLFRHGVRIETAIGTGVAALAACSIFGFFLHAVVLAAAFPWHYLAFTVPGVVFGGIAGARLGRWAEERMRARGHRSPLKAIFSGVVLLDGIVMLLHVSLAH